MDNRTNLFADPLWKYKLPSTIDTSWVLDNAYNLKKKDTNVFGGWQSFDEQEQFQYALPIPHGIVLQAYLDERMNSIAKGIGLPAVSLLNYWYNINPPGADSSYNDVIGTQTELTPEEKDVIIFMGWQKHSVLQNKSSEDRVSLSFNYGAIV